MWQRIQTLYLGIATALIISMFFCNAGTFIGPEGSETIRYYEKTSYLMFLIMVAMSNGISLFSYKARLLQMRITVISAILLLALQIWLGIDFARFQLGIGTDTASVKMIFSFTAVFPLIASILDLLAARNIALDEAMVQSSYRLRKSKRR